MTKVAFLFSFGLLLLPIACNSPTDPIQQLGDHYRQHRDLASLEGVVNGVELGIDTSEVARLLGPPIDMGFDYRYLVDSVGPGGCVVGAVFHIDDSGRIDQKWVGEICE